MERVTAAVRLGPVSSSYIKTAHKAARMRGDTGADHGSVYNEHGVSSYSDLKLSSLTLSIHPLTLRLTLTSHGFE